MAKRITWWQAAEILGISDRSMRRWREGYEKHGYEGLLDRRRGKPSGKRVPMATMEKVLRLYQEKYFDFNLRHFHETAIKEVIERQGLFCALYSDLASHFFETPKAGGPVDRLRRTQKGRALAGARDRADPGLLAASAWAERAEFRYLARTPAATIASGRDQRGGGSKSLSARAVHRRIQPRFPVPAQEPGTAFLRRGAAIWTGFSRSNMSAW
jgi:Winged helix-turn helix